MRILPKLVKNTETPTARPLKFRVTHPEAEGETADHGKIDMPRMSGATEFLPKTNFAQNQFRLFDLFS
jgi:hypothetical protein